MQLAFHMTVVNYVISISCARLDACPTCVVTLPHMIPWPQVYQNSCSLSDKYC